MTGFAKQVQGKGALIGLGDGQLTCASPDSANPPAGLTGILSLSSFAVGTYPGAPVTILKSDGNSLDAFGSSGDVAITAATASTISGTVQFSAADGSNTDTLDGMFEVVLCN